MVTEEETEKGENRKVNISDSVNLSATVTVERITEELQLLRKAVTGIDRTLQGVRELTVKTRHAVYWAIGLAGVSILISLILRFFV